MPAARSRGHKRPEASTVVDQPPWAGAPLVPGDWRELALAEAVPLLIRFAELSDYPAPGKLLLDHWPMRVRAMRPAYYPGWLLAEVQAAMPDGGEALWNFLYGPLGVVLLDGTSSPIHWLNDQVPPVLDPDETAADYLRFFCSAVRGDDGRFEVVERLDQLAQPADAELRKTIAQSAAGALVPVTIERDDPLITAKACVIYDRTLFRAEFVILPEGQINMTDDEPVAVLPVRREVFESPFRMIRDETGPGVPAARAGVESQ